MDQVHFYLATNQVSMSILLFFFSFGLSRFRIRVASAEGHVIFGVAA